MTTWLCGLTIKKELYTMQIHGTYLNTKPMHKKYVETLKYVKFTYLPLKS